MPLGVCFLPRGYTQGETEVSPLGSEGPSTQGPRPGYTVKQMQPSGTDGPTPCSQQVKGGNCPQQFMKHFLIVYRHSAGDRRGSDIQTALWQKAADSGGKQPHTAAAGAQGSTASCHSQALWRFLGSDFLPHCSKSMQPPGRASLSPQSACCALTHAGEGMVDSSYTEKG